MKCLKCWQSQQMPVANRELRPYEAIGFGEIGVVDII